MQIRTRYKGDGQEQGVKTPQGNKPRYKSGQRLDNPLLTPEFNPLNCSDISKRGFRAKIIVLPQGQYEMSVNRPEPEDVEAMGRIVRPCDMPVKSRTEEEQAERDEENKKRACRLARQKIRWLVKCIGGDHLLTPSYRPVVQDIEKVKRDFQEFIRLVRVRYPEFVYVAVFEKQRSDQPDWSYHLHLAVRGKQDIRWLLRCWLRAIGQPIEEVENWFVRGIKLGDKSLGAVNVTGPDKKYGTRSTQWKADRLSSYLTKYISKEFETAAKNAKKYWAPKGLEKPEIIKLWLGATNYPDAVREAHEMLLYRGVTHFNRLFGSESIGIIWITASTERKHIGQCSQGVPDLD